MQIAQFEVKRLPTRVQDVNVCEQNPDGKPPLIRLFDNVKLVKNVILVTDTGIEPVTPLPLKANLARYCKVPIELGNGPMTLLLVRSKVTIPKPLLQVTPNQPLIQGSPINQFVELIQLPPFVE